MNSNYTTAILSIASNTLLSCSQADTFSSDEKQAVIQEVRTMLTNYCADIRKSGLMAEFNYLDSSSNFFWVPPGYSDHLPYDTVSAIIRRNAAQNLIVDNNFQTLTVIPLTPELATYSGRILSLVTTTTGKSSSYLLVETGVVIKKDNRWKLLCGQTSLLEPNH